MAMHTCVVVVLQNWLVSRLIKASGVCVAVSSSGTYTTTAAVDSKEASYKAIGNCF